MGKNEPAHVFDWVLKHLQESSGGFYPRPEGRGKNEE
jgi:hypothetical protein